jgi:hypothetical protein
MVAKDGIEPPPPAFSGRASVVVNWLIPLILATDFDHFSDPELER